ncbi:hypothetical protein CsatA_004474 [Cannabis sativa]
MISKNVGGKYFSNIHNVFPISSCSLSNFDGSTVLAQIALKKKTHPCYCISYMFL